MSYNEEPLSAVPPARTARPIGRTDAPEGKREAGVLDNITESASIVSETGFSAPSYVDHSTGEVLLPYDPTLKWQLQAVARLALGKHRLQVCMRHVRKDRQQVEVKQSWSKKCYYAGLMACGLTWLCPVCAAKIQAVRALEVRKAIDEWLAQGGQVLMLTQTVPHSRRDVLETLLANFLEAMRAFKSGRAYQVLVKRYGIAGSIKALEVTHGDYGWHPHCHSILFLEAEPFDMLQLHADVFARWQTVTANEGFGAVSEKALSLQDAAAVKTYVTKYGQEYQWSAEHELVKSHTKTGRTGRTPFDFLRDYLATPGDGRDLALFAEFAFTFHGRAQLMWSPGLKRRLLGNEGKSDQQIADSIGEVDDTLAHITLEEWKLIRKRNYQGQVLQIVQDHGKEGLKHMLAALAGQEK
jgi:rubredoxin